MAEDTNILRLNYSKSGEARHMCPIPLINVHRHNGAREDFCPCYVISSMAAQAPISLFSQPTL